MFAKPIWTSSNVILMIFGCFMLSGLMLLAWLGSPPKVEAVGKPLPLIELEPLVGVEQPLRMEELSGKIAVIHFWGTWCPPCVAEYPDFATLAGRFGEHEEVKIISVSSSAGPDYDVGALRQQTLDFMQARQAVLPTYCDPAAYTRGKLALMLPNGSFSYPTTFLVDRRGVIVATLVGSAPGDMEQLARRIESLL
jgi:cytochrome c biogenesis protein CcmG, thiol:disulfide interchange protein DsbE